MSTSRALGASWGRATEESALDEAAIRQFLETDYPRLVAAIALVSESRSAAEDAVQEALARAWERMDRGDSIDSLKAWVTTVALNLVRSGFRRLRAERRARERMVDPAVTTPDAGIDLRRALGHLSRRQRQAVVLHYYLDMPVAETATAMRVTDGTVKTLLHRARSSLANALGEPEEVRDRGGR